MRQWITGLMLALSLTACGGDSTGPSRTEGTVLFVLDGQTCPAGNYAIELFINGVSKGAYTMSPGSAGQSFTVLAGQMAVSARLSNTGFIWGPTSITVNPGVTFTYTMYCQ